MFRSSSTIAVTLSCRRTSSVRSFTVSTTATSSPSIERLRGERDLLLFSVRRYHRTLTPEQEVVFVVPFHAELDVCVLRRFDHRFDRRTVRGGVRRTRNLGSGVFIPETRCF
ncbi:hypothetical protein [Haladaptatus halobius]|uniref:hypothetical protein n=1 Tax=Haladaptatus halobius TaxID=2884875 RepID=UPI001D0A015D|nr:hypothetical protein [Haladaptatus halobius]